MSLIVHLQQLHFYFLGRIDKGKSHVNKNVVLGDDVGTLNAFDADRVFSFEEFIESFKRLDFAVVEHVKNRLEALHSIILLKK